MVKRGPALEFFNHVLVLYDCRLEGRGVVLAITRRLERWREHREVMHDVEFGVEFGLLVARVAKTVGREKSNPLASAGLGVCVVRRVYP